MMAFIRVIALALALATSSGWSPHPSESARNQYEAREDKLQPQMLTEATDHHPPEGRQGDSIRNSTKQEALDLQVGCGDGFIQENIQAESEVDKNTAQKKGRNLSKLPRRRRSYTPWTGQVVYSAPYPSINMWKPPVYQLSRPYVIPIFGVSGRIPIYYPPQPLHVNPGSPQDNPPKRPFQGPSYLPPSEPSTVRPPGSTTMEIGNRFNGGDNSDDRPVWGNGDGDQTSNERPTTSSSVMPTRRPIPPGAVNSPPLIHNPTDPEGFAPSPTIVEPNGNRLPTEGPPRMTSSAPRPITSTTQRPLMSRPNEPSRCVWAIISCCSTSNQISYDCFEQRNCPGPFWDGDPCDSDFARAAIAAALNYYNK